MSSISFVWTKLVFVLALICTIRLATIVIMSGVIGERSEQVSGRFWAVEGLSPIGQRLVFRDAGAYLTISEDGYQADHLYSAFYPLWPLLIQPIVLHLPKAMIPWGVWLVSNVLTIVGSCFLFSLAANTWGRDCAWMVLLLQNSLPASFFLYLPFTEPLFFCLFCVLLWALERRLLLIAGVVSFLLPLARPVGVLLLPGVALWNWRQGATVRLRLCLPLAMLAGFISYLGCMYSFTGNAFEGFEAQKLHINQPSVAYFFAPWTVLERFFSVASFLDPIEGLIDRLCFLAVLVPLVMLWRIDRRLWFMVAPMAIIPAITNLFLSYRRFMVLFVPITMIVAYRCCESAQRKRALLWLCVIGWGIQLIQQWEHISGRWAG